MEEAGQLCLMGPGLKTSSLSLLRLPLLDWGSVIQKSYLGGQMCPLYLLLSGHGEVLQYVHVYLCVTFTSQIPGNISNMNPSSENGFYRQDIWK